MTGRCLCLCLARETVKHETCNRGIGKSDCVTGRITSTRPVHNHLLPTPRLTVSYLTIQYQTTFLWMGFCEI